MIINETGQGVFGRVGNISSFTDMYGQQVRVILLGFTTITASVSLVVCTMSQFSITFYYTAIRNFYFSYQFTVTTYRKGNSRLFDFHFVATYSIATMYVCYKCDYHLYVSAINI